MTDPFFEEAQEQSQIKTEIVAKYFWAWAKVMTSRPTVEKIAYVDIFAGPGIYKDGTESTPVQILKRAVADDKMRRMLVTVFNDSAAENVKSLERTIRSIPDITLLKHAPDIHNVTVGSEIVKVFQGMRLVPTLLFVDPFGYKGLTLDLIGSVLKDWGCECIFFFNYLRINMAIDNPVFVDHMNAIFGKERAAALRKRLEPMGPETRELTIVEELFEALKEKGGKYGLPFRFKKGAGVRTSHHLIFVTKNILGYEIMKDIMARKSSDSQKGAASFEFNPATSDQPLLFQFNRPVEDLGDMLLDEFAGRTKTMREVYYEHNVGRPFVRPNYKDVLARLEADGKIKTDPPASQRKKIKGKITFADDVKITFSSKGGQSR